MQYRSLGTTGMRVSVLSFGGSSLGGVFHAVDEQEGTRAVRTALELGINFFDVSPYYGLTKAETLLGRALHGIPRERYFLATKCGRYGSQIQDCDYSAQHVIRSVDESLDRLGVDYLDVIQVHDMEFGNLTQIVNETIPELAKLKERGKTRFVGITGLPLRMFLEVIGRAPPGIIDTILSYCHYQLNDTSLMEIVPAIMMRGVGVINASPLGMGLLSLRGAPEWHPAPVEVKQRCRLAAEHCQRRGMSIVKLAIQFSVAEPQITTTLVSTSNPHNIAQNVAWLSEPLDHELLAEVMEILQPIKNVTWSQGRPENN